MTTTETLIDDVRRAYLVSENAAVAFLNCCLFAYEQRTKKIASLSGRERSRLQLAWLVLHGASSLRLDEPTNYLDIASAEVLEAARDEFEGAALMISPDRFFLDRTVTRSVELENGVLSNCAGEQSDYAETKNVLPMRLA